MSAGGVDLVIMNQVEFNRATMWGFNEGERQVWDRGAEGLTDQGLLWGGMEKLVLATVAPAPAQVEELCATLGVSKVKVLVPGGRGVFLSRRILEDRELFDYLAARLGRGEGNRLLAWGMTRGLATLIARLREAGAVFGTPELPEPETLALCANFESKAGARMLLARAGIPVPEGYLLTSLPDCAEAMRYLGGRGCGAVAKANNGAGGFAVKAYTAAELRAKSAAELTRELEVRAKLDGYWRSCLFVVERLVEAGPDGETLCPTTNWITGGGGGNRCAGTGLMRIKRRTLYEGVVAGRGALSPAMERRVEEIGGQVAALLAQKGYRGWFDADMVVGAGGTVLVNEINLRRTCPSHAFDFARAVRGEEWRRLCAVESVERCFLPGAKPGLRYDDLAGVFRDFNWEGAGAGRMAVPTGVSGCLNRIPAHVGFAVLARDAWEAKGAAEELRGRLRRAAVGAP